MPSYTFVSTANAFLLRGGVPVFVDIRPDTMNIDEKQIEAAIITDAPEGFPFIRSHHALRRILNHKKVVTLCDIHDRIHFAGYSGVVHRRNA